MNNEVDFIAYLWNQNRNVRTIPEESSKDSKIAFIAYLKRNRYHRHSDFFDFSEFDFLTKDAKIEMTTYKQ